jgi:FixJ family two-component response regulator
MRTHSAIRVLIIDDDPIVRENIAAYLEDSEFIPLQAHDGKAGLGILLADTPDIVLVDLDMPEVDGYTVLSRLQEIAAETPVIVVTGVGDVESTTRASRLGAWDFVLKPIHNMAVVEYTINRALERRCLLRENREYRENLERKVRERTQALQARTRELEAEIEIRRLAEARLRQSKKRSTALRRFSARIAEFSDEESLLKAALALLGTHMYLSGAVLYYHFECDRFARYEFGNPACGFLARIPTYAFLKSIMAGRAQEVAVLNYVKADEAVRAFYRSAAEDDLEGTHFIFFRARSLRQHLFCVYREPLLAEFDHLDVAFVRSVVNEINNVYHSIQLLRENLWLERELMSLVPSAAYSGTDPSSTCPGFEMASTVFPIPAKPRNVHHLLTVRPPLAAILLGDIPGRGISALMYLELSKNLLKNQTELDNPNRVMALLNRHLQTAFLPNHFLTLGYILLNYESGELEYCNLGSEPMVFIKISRQDRTVLKSVRQPFVQLQPETTIEDLEQVTERLQPGDCLFCCSSRLRELTTGVDGQIETADWLDPLIGVPDQAPVPLLEGVTRRLAARIDGSLSGETVNLVLIRRGLSTDSRR